MIRSSQLPFLPGYSFNYNVGQTKFHKSQHLALMDNKIPYLAEKLLPGIGGAPLPYVKPSEFPSLYAKGEVSDIPSWLVYDKQILCFNAYYLETILDGGLYSNYMVRNCKILYYLEDGTMQVIEKPVINSGLAQGVLVKRQKIRVPGSDDCSDFYGVLDLNVGKEIEIFGKVFKITDCDMFTRRFMNRLGIPVAEGISCPNDPYLQKRITSVQNSKGKAVKSKTISNLMEIDNRILAFGGYWDDRDTEGGFVHHLKILYYLSDGTIEIKDVTDKNKSFFIVKRSKIPKEVSMRIPQPGENEQVTLLNVLGPSKCADKSRFLVDPLGIGIKEEVYYTEKDITIGSFICSFGRRFVITSMDKFTREYYSQKYGLDDLSPLEIPKDKDDEECVEGKDTRPEIPPYNGFGSYEDSLVNCLYIDPKSHVKRWQRSENEPFGYDSKILRFAGELVTEKGEPIARDREFIVLFYLQDNTISVYEIPRANSGIAGGNIIRRRKVYKPGQPKFTNKPPEEITAEEFYLGNIINLENFLFYLKDIDEYSMRFMELHPNAFPKNNIRIIIDKLREGVRSNYRKWAAQFFQGQELKPIPYYLFRNFIVKELGNKITDHEILALGRHLRVPFSSEKTSMENVRCLIHDEFKRLLYDDFTRLQEHFQHFDKEKSGFVNLRDAYTALRGGKIPLRADFIRLLVEMFAKIQNNEDKIDYRQLIDFLNYKKAPVSSIQRAGFSQIYEFEKLATAAIDTKGSYINVQCLLDALNLEEDLKKEGI